MVFVKQFTLQNFVIGRSSLKATDPQAKALTGALLDMIHIEYVVFPLVVDRPTTDYLSH